MMVAQAIEIVRRASRAGIDAEAAAAVLAIVVEVLDAEHHVERDERPKHKRRGRPPKPRATKAKAKAAKGKRGPYKRKPVAESNGATPPARTTKPGEGVSSVAHSKRELRARTWVATTLREHPEGMLRGELLRAAHKGDMSEVAIERALVKLSAVTSNELRGGERVSVVRLP